jgi:hypothetical protein
MKSLIAIAILGGIVFGIPPGLIILPTMQDLLVLNQDWLRGWELIGGGLSLDEFDEREVEVNERYNDACEHLQCEYKERCEKIENEWADCDFRDRYLEILREKRDIRLEQLEKWHKQTLETLRYWRQKKIEQLFPLEVEGY